jgi:hypothetical protein
MRDITIRFEMEDTAPNEFFIDALKTITETYNIEMEILECHGITS